MVGGVGGLCVGSFGASFVKSGGEMGVVGEVVWPGVGAGKGDFEATWVTESLYGRGAARKGK